MSERKRLWGGVTVSVVVLFGLYLGNQFFRFHEWSNVPRFTEYGYFHFQLCACLIMTLVVSSGLFILMPHFNEKSLQLGQARGILGRGLFLAATLPILASWLFPLVKNVPVGVEEARGVYRFMPNNRTLKSEVVLHETQRQRNTQLMQLKNALWDYAESHDGNFPTEIDESGITRDLWHVKGYFEIDYDYQPASIANVDEQRQPLVIEPRIVDGDRFILWSNGDVELFSSEEINALTF